MKKYTKIAKLGRGTFGDVILAKKEDEENENVILSILCILCKLIFIL